MRQQRHDSCDHQHGPVTAWDRRAAGAVALRIATNPNSTIERPPIRIRKIRDPSTAPGARTGQAPSRGEQLIRSSRPVRLASAVVPGACPWPIVHRAIPLMSPIRASNGPRIFHPVAVPNQQTACGQNGRRIFLGGHVPMPIRYRVPTAHRIIPSLPIVPGPASPGRPSRGVRAVWSLTLTSGFYFVNGNICFSGLNRFWSKYWCLRPRSPQSPGYRDARGRLFCEGRASSEAESSSRQSWTHKPKPASASWMVYRFGQPRSRVELGKQRLLCYKNAAYSSVGCDRTIGNPSCPHRLVRPRTSALQAENGGSNPPGDTTQVQANSSASLTSASLLGRFGWRLDRQGLLLGPVVRVRASGAGTSR